MLTAFLSAAPWSRSRQSRLRSPYNPRNPASHPPKLPAESPTRRRRWRTRFAQDRGDGRDGSYRLRARCDHDEGGRGRRAGFHWIRVGGRREACERFGAFLSFFIPRFLFLSFMSCSRATRSSVADQDVALIGHLRYRYQPSR
jgi:hypothetical protein